MKNKILIGLIVLILLALGVYLYAKNQDLVSSEWVQYRGGDRLEDITFEYPSDWKVIHFGTNTSDEGTSAIRVWKGKEQILFIQSDQAAIMPGCDKVTALVDGTSETTQRIFSSAKCLR